MTHTQFTLTGILLVQILYFAILATTKDYGFKYPSLLAAANALVLFGVAVLIAKVF